MNDLMCEKLPREDIEMRRRYLYLTLAGIYIVSGGLWFWVIHTAITMVLSLWT